MTPDDLDEIRERLAKCTPGPWRTGSASHSCLLAGPRHAVQCPDYRKGGPCSATKVVFYGDPKSVCSEDDGSTIVLNTHGEYNNPRPEDCAFIAAAPTDIAALLAHVDEVARIDRERMDMLDLAVADSASAWDAVREWQEKHAEVTRERDWQAARHMEALDDIAAAITERNDARRHEQEAIIREREANERVRELEATLRREREVNRNIVSAALGELATIANALGTNPNFEEPESVSGDAVRAIDALRAELEAVKAERDKAIDMERTMSSGACIAAESYASLRSRHEAQGVEIERLRAAMPSEDVVAALGEALFAARFRTITPLAEHAYDACSEWLDALSAAAERSGT